MITYVDTSALIKLIIDEEGSDRVEVVWRAADAVVSAALVVVEGRAALAAANRSGRLSDQQHADAKSEIDQLAESLHLVALSDEVLTSATDLAEAEALRGYDAVHLAAALSVGVAVFASADEALCAAAARRGMHVANPLAY